MGKINKFSLTNKIQPDVINTYINNLKSVTDKYSGSNFERDAERNFRFSEERRSIWLNDCSLNDYGVLSDQSINKNIEKFLNGYGVLSDQSINKNIEKFLNDYGVLSDQSINKNIEKFFNNFIGDDDLKRAILSYQAQSYLGVWAGAQINIGTSEYFYPDPKYIMSYCFFKNEDGDIVFRNRALYRDWKALNSSSSNPQKDFLRYKFDVHEAIDFTFKWHSIDSLIQEFKGINEKTDSKKSDELEKSYIRIEALIQKLSGLRSDKNIPGLNINKKVTTTFSYTFGGIEYTHDLIVRKNNYDKIEVLFPNITCERSFSIDDNIKFHCDDIDFTEKKVNSRSDNYCYIMFYRGILEDLIHCKSIENTHRQLDDLCRYEIRQALDDSSITEDIDFLIELDGVIQKMKNDFKYDTYIIQEELDYFLLPNDTDDKSKMEKKRKYLLDTNLGSDRSMLRAAQAKFMLEVEVKPIENIKIGTVVFTCVFFMLAFLPLMTVLPPVAAIAIPTLFGVATLAAPIVGYSLFRYFRVDPEEGLFPQDLRSLSSFDIRAADPRYQNILDNDSEKYIELTNTRKR